MIQYCQVLHAAIDYNSLSRAMVISALKVSTVWKTEPACTVNLLAALLSFTRFFVNLHKAVGN